MLVDFTEVKKYFNSVLDELDHKYLNELPAFRDLFALRREYCGFVYKN